MRLLLCILYKNFKVPGYKAGSENKVHMEPFLHIIDCQMMPVVCTEYSVFVFLGRNIQSLNFLEQDN